MEFIITYKVRRTDASITVHTSKVTAKNAVDGLFKAFEGCPQYTRNRIFDITITENKGE
jgi:hypothetical protein